MRTSGVLFRHLHFIILRQALFLNLELIDAVRLSCQRASEIELSVSLVLGLEM